MMDLLQAAETHPIDKSARSEAATLRTEGEEA